MIFYGINVLFAYVAYDDSYIHYLSIFLGVNIIFDNLISAIKNVNVAMFEQGLIYLPDRRRLEPPDDLHDFEFLGG